MLGYIILLFVCLASVMAGMYVGLLVHTEKLPSRTSQGELRGKYQSRAKTAETRKKPHQKPSEDDYTPPILDIEDLFMPEDWMLDEDGNPINEMEKENVAADTTNSIAGEEAEDSSYVVPEELSPLSKIDKSNSFTDFNCELDDEDVSENIAKKMTKQDSRYRKKLKEASSAKH